ncbi:MAG TPA: glycosidase [Nitrososphaeria archaeon]|nr:MAG: glycosidase [Candidatus Wolframiiraptor sp.]HDD40257.1 glycosidase [Nitrososphaeria archaeon]
MVTESLKSPVMSGRVVFAKAEGCEEASKLRIPEVNDIVSRFGVISPNRIAIHDYPLSHPLAAFNAGVIYDHKDEVLELYARIILGYYLYVSSIIRTEVPLDDLFNRFVDINSYVGEVVVYPSTKYDIWGAEDPRVYRVDGKLHMTYTGRSINYFSSIRENRTLPVTAVYDDALKAWVKRYVFILSEKKFGKIVSNKDSFIHRTRDGRVFVFHRPHLITDTIHLVASEIDEKKLINHGIHLREIEIDNAVEIIEKAPFEGKLGWATPITNRHKDRLIVLIHAVDKDFVVYRVFAAELQLSKEGVIVEAVTPRYIMEPRRTYEKIGDRPLTIFPCGAANVGRDEVVITYGAADSMIGLGIVSLSNLLGELDKGRIY